MTSANAEQLDAQRQRIFSNLGDPEQVDFDTGAGKLQIIGAILSSRVLKRDQTYELQCLRIVFSDATALQLGLDWLMMNMAGAQLCSPSPRWFC